MKTVNEKIVNETIEKNLLEVKELGNEGMHTVRFPRSGCSCSSSSTDGLPEGPPEM